MTSKSILIILSYSVSVHFSCIFCAFFETQCIYLSWLLRKVFLQLSLFSFWQPKTSVASCQQATKLQKSSLALYCSSPGISVAESFKRPNQQYQSTEGNATKDKSNNENNKIHICIDNNRHKKDIHKISTTSPLVYTNIGRLGDGSSRGQVRQA